MGRALRTGEWIILGIAALGIPALFMIRRQDVPVATDQISVGEWQNRDGLDFQYLNAGTERQMVVFLPGDRESAIGSPLVVVGSAGSRLFHGVTIGEDDFPELIPYAKAGYVVIGFSSSGPLEADRPSGEEIFEATKAFLLASGGVLDAKKAIDFAVEDLKVDQDHIFIAGHSSAGTLALQTAMTDSRIRATAAFAPVVGVKEHLGDTAGLLENEVSGFREWLVSSDPINNVSKIKTPVFLFHAKDDPIVSSAQTDRFWSQLKVIQPKSTFDEVETGGHYDSMISRGIDSAIHFFNQNRD